MKNIFFIETEVGGYDFKVFGLTEKEVKENFKVQWKEVVKNFGEPEMKKWDFQEVIDYFGGGLHEVPMNGAVFGGTPYDNKGKIV